jgi:hypothetical protein
MCIRDSVGSEMCIRDRSCGVPRPTSVDNWSHLLDKDDQSSPIGDSKDIKDSRGGRAALEAVQSLVPGAVKALERLFANADASPAVVAQAATAILKMSLEYATEADAQTKQTTAFKLIDRESFHSELSRRLAEKRTG